MKKKVKVRICLGTACFVQGGADLLLYNDFLAPEVAAWCEIEGCSCLGGCKSSSGTAPYVEIDGKRYDSVNPERFSKLLEEAVRNA